MGQLGAILRMPKPIGSEKAIMPKTLIFPRLLDDFCILESAVEGSKGTWICLGAALRPLGCVSEAILSHLELSWAIFEAILLSLRPSWSRLGPKRTLCHLGPPPSRPKEGGGGISGRLETETL